MKRNDPELSAKLSYDLGLLNSALPPQEQIFCGGAIGVYYRARIFKAALTAALALSFLAISEFSARAHPGHGLTEKGAIHLFTSLDHLAVLALLGMAMWGIGSFIKRQWTKRFLRYTGAAITLAAAALYYYP